MAEASGRGPFGMVPAGHFVVPADHPSLPGHFPGEPIVPGVVLLDETLAIVVATRPGMRLASVPQAKFSAAVGPGDRVDVACRAPSPGEGARVAFECAVGGLVAVRGTALLAPASPDGSGLAGPPSPA